MKTRYFTIIGMCGLMGLAVGCDTADRIYDCAKICDKYSDCIDDSIDKADCVSSCESHGDDDMDFASKANDCEQCLDDKSCTEATVECGVGCAEVVAKSTD
jgi:hypothetical protein